MTKFFAIAAVALGLAAAPAAAVTQTAFGSFNGTNGNGGFVYGFTDSTTLTAFDTGASSGCALGAGSTCLYSSALGVLPQASIGGGIPTVDVPADAVLLHPGNADSQSVYGAFAAATTSAYSYTISLKSVGNDNITGGVGYTPFTSIGGVVTLGTRNVLPTYLSAATLSGTTVLAAGQQLGVIIDRNGVYFGDSTAVNISISNVPEPATWGLMIVGFGMVGVTARRRRRQVAVTA